MIDYVNANPLQQSFFKKLLNLLLLGKNFHQHYRVHSTDDFVYIRVSTQNPPAFLMERNFEALMGILVQMEVFKFKKGIIKIANQSVSGIKITHINEKLIDAVFRAGLQDKPQNIDEKMWDILPDPIKLRWQRFSNDMQVHIVKCLDEKLEEKYADLLTSRVLGETFRSPVGLEHPKIPVRLPNETLGKSNEVYDLLEVLNISQRDPSNPALRLDPINRKPFDLKDLVPAPEALQELKRRAEAAAPRLVPRP